MAASGQRYGEPIHGINVTPLVDVVLVLLIILMVTSSYAVSRALPMQLPKASTGEAALARPLAISIDAQGRLYLDGQASSTAELRSRARASRGGADPSAVIAADGAVAHRAVVGVIDALRSEGISQFAINVAPEDLQP
jgi:biopolymer transport protein ExbD